MKLKPVIASYIGESYNKAIKTLTNDYLDVIAKIAEAPLHEHKIIEKMLNELIEMHVVVKESNIVKLNTSVFLKDDIRRLVTLTSNISRNLAKELIHAGVELKNASSEIKCFLAGIIGVAQGSSKFHRDKHISVDWKNYSGKYAKTKKYLSN